MSDIGAYLKIIVMNLSKKGHFRFGGNSQKALCPQYLFKLDQLQLFNRSYGRK